ncbi:MAG: CD225/dispanin family protein [Actinobacteria bacterium]|nr:CD225/dispanin family protein [Actinomycetota bacterium]
MSGQRDAALPPPNSWLIPAIVATLCFFPLTGVVAVYFAGGVRARAENGDMAGADRAARRARLWTLISFALFIVVVAAMVATGGLFGFVDRLRE